MQLLCLTALFLAPLLVEGTYPMSASIEVRQLAARNKQTLIREAPHAAFVCAHLLYWNGQERHEYLKHFPVLGNQPNRILLVFPLLLFLKNETPSAIGHSAPFIDKHLVYVKQIRTAENPWWWLFLMCKCCLLLKPLKLIRGLHGVALAIRHSGTLQLRLPLCIAFVVRPTPLSWYRMQHLRLRRVNRLEEERYEDAYLEPVTTVSILFL